MSRFRIVVTSLTLVVSLMMGVQALAQGYKVEDTGLNAAADAAQYDINQPCVNQPGGCIPLVVGQVVSALLGIVGALFLILIIWGGAQYMLAGGDEGKVKSAKNTIRNAVLGLVIVVSSYAIATFVLNAVSGVTSGGSDVQTPSG